MHKMLSVSPETMTGECVACGPVSLRKKGVSYLCSASQDRWAGDVTQKRRVRQLRAELLKQQGVVALPVARKMPTSSWHCHDSKLVRGVLCNRCNRVLGMCDEDLAVFEGCIKYLKGEPTEHRWPGRKPKRRKAVWREESI